MANIILYETSTGGEREGDYPEFVVDPDFAIYSPRVSGKKKEYSKELTSQEINQGYIVQSTPRGDVNVEIIGNYSEGNTYQYEIYFYPRMYDDGLISETWFFSYDQNNDVDLDNWTKNIRVKYVNDIASFSIGATLLNENASRKLVHENFGEIDLGYPDFLSDGIWMYVQNKVLEIPELSTNVGWCWFNREYASSFGDGNFFWFADSASIEASSLTRIGTYTNGQCVLFYSQSAASMCAAIVNTSGELFISVLSDQYKTKYYKLVN